MWYSLELGSRKSAESKLQIRHHDTELHAMEGRRLVSTQVVDVQSKLGGDGEAGKGDSASEQTPE